MLIEQVDMVSIEPQQRCVNNGADMIGAAVEALSLPPFGIDVEAEFRGDDDLVANRFQALAQLAFVDMRPIDFGGIEKSDAPVLGRAQQITRIRLAQRRAIGSAQAHAAKPDRGYLEALAQSTLVHGILPCSNNGAATQ